MSDKYGAMKMNQLQDELRKRNAKVSGRKKDLIERLESYDRNENFGNTDVTGPNYQMDLPHISTYCDLNNEKTFVRLNMDQITQYLRKFDKELDQSAHNLYLEQYLGFLRLSSSSDKQFVKSSCRAEMKKSVIYEVDLYMDKDGFVEECQCECAAGMGPTAHCKHVCAVLLALLDFSLKGTAIVEQTCTEKLQTFHHCKKYKGSPLKANLLKMPGTDEISDFDFDPRPKKFRNMAGYNDFFRNVCINSAPKEKKMPIFQLFPPANIRALAHDHDYFSNSHEEHFLRTSNITQIDKKTTQNIQLKTVKQAMSKLWKRERRYRLTASNFGRICKCTERTDKKKLSQSYLHSRNLKTLPIQHGKKYEGIAVKKYSIDNKCAVTPCGLFVYQDKPYIAASPDGIVSDDVIIEVKCPYVAKNKHISNNTVPYLKHDDQNNLKLDIHHDYYYQIQGQLLCTGRTYCDLVVYTLVDVKYFRIERDDKFIAQMVEKLDVFFNRFHRESVLEKFFYKSIDF